MDGKQKGLQAVFAGSPVGFNQTLPVQVLLLDHGGGLRRWASDHNACDAPLQGV